MATNIKNTFIIQWISHDSPSLNWINPHKSHMGVSENVVYPIVPNGFADHYPVFKWLAIIGNIPNIFSQTHIIFLWFPHS